MPSTTRRATPLTTGSLRHRESHSVTQADADPRSGVKRASRRLAGREGRVIGIDEVAVTYRLRQLDRTADIHGYRGPYRTPDLCARGVLGNARSDRDLVAAIAHRRPGARIETGGRCD